MFLSTLTHTPSTSRSGKGTVGHTLQVLIIPLQLLHLLCLLGGPLVAFGYCVWITITWFTSLETTASVVPHLLLGSPWRALGLLGVVYSAFVWIFYVLPTWTRTAERTRRLYILMFPRRALWKHIALWGLIFGPLIYQYKSTAILSWPVIGGVIAGLMWAFYETVWKEMRLLRQRGYEFYKVYNRCMDRRTEQ